MYIGSIGYHLRMLRLSRNYTQGKVATDLCLTAVILSNFENNKRKFTLEIINLFAEYYNVKPEEIIGENPLENYIPK